MSHPNDSLYFAPYSRGGPRPRKNDHWRNPYQYRPFNNKLYQQKPRFKRKPRYPIAKQKPPIRPESPLCGSEEHTLKKIQEASDMIKKQLLMPPGSEALKPPTTLPPVKKPATTPQPPGDTTMENPAKPRKITINVEEIHDKIISHITKMSHGRKMNLISSSSSGYDTAIQHIQKQKRLELSKALREMCSSQTTNNSDFIQSIIPDIGINIGDLPLEIIQQLSTTLDLNLDQPQTETTIKVEDGVSEAVLPTVPKIENDSSEATVTQKPTFYDFPVLPVIKREPLDPEDKDCAPFTPTIDSTTATKSTQTDPIATNTTPRNSPETLDEAINEMLQIDREIEQLTQRRQSLFTHLQNKTILYKKKQWSSFAAPLDFGTINEKVLVIKVLENHRRILAGCESGKLFVINLRDGATVDCVLVTSVPITALGYWPAATPLLFIGSYEATLKEYFFDTITFSKGIAIPEGAACLELKWDCIFIGTRKGNLIRYHLKRNKIEFEDHISDDIVMVLKAAQEGGRRVLLVGTRNSPVCVRDAMSGLRMRTMDGLISPTVYSLVLEKSLVYCGTTFHDILVFSFHDGTLIHKHTAANAKGISCMKVVENLLFASCHNGNIYVYHTKSHAHVGTIDGPGGVILSMEIVANLIIVGTMSLNFKSLLIPNNILRQNNDDESRANLQ